MKEKDKLLVQLDQAECMDELSGRALVEPVTKKSTLWEMFHGEGASTNASPVHQTTVTDE